MKWQNTRRFAFVALFAVMLSVVGLFSSARPASAAQVQWYPDGFCGTGMTNNNFDDTDYSYGILYSNTCNGSGALVQGSFSPARVASSITVIYAQQGDQATQYLEMYIAYTDGTAYVPYFPLTVTGPGRATWTVEIPFYDAGKSVSWVQLRLKSGSSGALGIDNVLLNY